MSSDKFEFVLLKIPEVVDQTLIKSLKERALNITAEEAVNINEVLCIDVGDISKSKLREDDLFEIAEDDLATKKAVQDFLCEAISKVLLPRLYDHNRVASPLCLGEFSYIKIEEKQYVIAGQIVGYYGARDSMGFKYVLALSLSNILTSACPMVC